MVPTRKGHDVSGTALPRHANVPADGGLRVVPRRATRVVARRAAPRPLSTRRIALVVGLIYYVAALVVFRDVLLAIPDVLAGRSVIVGDELVPFFNPTDQLLDQAAGRFNDLTHGYEFRVRYAFLTTWLRYYKVLPFAILLVIPSIYWAVYLTVARFMVKVFTTLSAQSVYLATAFPVALIYMIMTYAKVTHFYTLIIGLALMTISALWMLYALLFAPRRWKRYAVVSSVATLLNPAIHYLILFTLFFAITVVTLALGELARWIRRGGPARLRPAVRAAGHLLARPGRRSALVALVRRALGTVLGRCVSAGVLYACVTLVPYGLFVKFVALRGVANLSETVPGDYYFIRDASVSWVHVLSWDLAGITDKLLYGDYLAKVPRYPDMVYTLLLLVPLLVPPVTRALFVTRPHRQLLGVVYVAIAFAAWATIGYAQPLWFPTFHRALAALARGADATDSPAGDLVLKVASTIVQVLRFPHRFQLILFMLAPLVMSLTLALGIDTVTARLLGRADRARGPGRTRVDPRGTKDQLVLRLLATLCIGSVFFTPFWSNSAYRKAFSSGNFAGFLAPYPLHDLRQLKDALGVLPEGKTVVLPPTETAKLVTDANGVDHRFIDKFFIYYLDKPSYYYGLTGDTKNKFEFFLMLRGMYYQQDWWVDVARDLDIRYVVVNRKLRDNRGVGAEYLPDVEHYVEPDIKRLSGDLTLRFQNDTYALYELTDPPKPQRELMLVDSSWSSFLSLVSTRLDLSRCYDLEYLPYYDPKARAGQPMRLVTDDPRSAALDLYLLDHRELIGTPDTRIFAFNPDIVASSYYLSPMFRSFLFFSTTKWNRTGIITPGVFGSLRGSFVGLPRATRVTVPLKIPAAGRYRLLLRGAVTANQLRVTAPSASYDRTLELRPHGTDLQLFDTADVYDAHRVPVDTTKMSVGDLERAIPDELTPVNRSLAYADLGVIDAPQGTVNVQLRKTDTNPMLLEGVMAVPEADYASLRLDPSVSVVTDPDTLDCSQKTPMAGKDQMYVAPAQNDAHADLSQEELTDLAASGVEDMVPDPTGGVGPSWLSLLTTSLLLVLSGVVVRWRSRVRPEDEDPDGRTGNDDDPGSDGTSDDTDGGPPDLPADPDGPGRHLRRAADD